MPPQKPLPPDTAAPVLVETPAEVETAHSPAHELTYPLIKTWRFRIGFALVVACTLLRFYHLNWDGYLMFHPDEGNIATAVNNIRLFYPPERARELNPNFFAYGGLTIYLYRFACEALAWLGSLLGSTPEAKDAAMVWINDGGHVNLVGRVFSALFSALTILPLWHLARRVFGTGERGTRLADFTAVLYAFCVTSIQMAHFDTTESLLALQITFIALVALKIGEKPSLKNYALMGVLGGLSLATKMSAISFAVFPLLAHFVAIVKGWRESQSSKERRGSFTVLSMRLFLCMVIAGVLFFAGSPYTFVDKTGHLVAMLPHDPGATLSERFLNPDLIGSMQYEGGVVTGEVPVNYTLQFDGTKPYVFWLYNLFWQLGPVALLCMIGTIGLLVDGVRRRDWRVLVLLSFPLAYFAYIGKWHTKFNRYMIPLVPFLLIAGAWLLVACEARLRRWGQGLVVAPVLVTVWWAGAFTAIYRNEASRIATSRWIYEHVPRGEEVIREHWDYGLPTTVVMPDGEERNGGDYPAVVDGLTVYDNEFPIQGKAAYYARELAKAPYMVIASRRLYGTLPRLTEKFPLTGRYYRLLFAGQLGYTRVATFTSYPSLLGITIPDDASEETFQVFDHPKCIIFKNTGHLPTPAIYKRLMSDEPPTDSLPYPH